MREKKPLILEIKFMKVEYSTFMNIEKTLKKKTRFCRIGESMVDITTPIHIMKTKALYTNFIPKFMLLPPTLT